ncbi:MAG TPA: hypothetical protein PKA16_03055 [Ottowia sp.]|uniref:hypothetical protein n=1 Tax=Ottowia sp. TaxID=1898956 RepID=UPI002C402B52|nr:hypothetical protein [Ottowia sp.]HMN20352.1 hypothetical protein [Ottowia sp.]
MSNESHVRRQATTTRCRLTGSARGLKEAVLLARVVARAAAPTDSSHAWHACRDGKRRGVPGAIRDARNRRGQPRLQAWPQHGCTMGGVAVRHDGSMLRLWEHRNKMQSICARGASIGVAFVLQAGIA